MKEKHLESSNIRIDGERFSLTEENAQQKRLNIPREIKNILPERNFKSGIYSSREEKVSLERD